MKLVAFMFNSKTASKIKNKMEDGAFLLLIWCNVLPQQRKLQQSTHSQGCVQLNYLQR